MSVLNGNAGSAGEEFTFTVVSNAEKPKVQSKDDLPNHVKYLQDKLRRQQARRKKLEEQAAKEESLRQLLERAELLNKESEKHNTQAAVLLSALQSLESDYRSSEQEKQSLFDEISLLKQEGIAARQEADQSLDSLQAGQQTLDSLLAQANNAIAETAEATIQTAKSAKLAANTQRDAQQIIESCESQLGELDSARRGYEQLRTDARDVLSSLAKAEENTSKLNADSHTVLETSNRLTDRVEGLFSKLQTEYANLEMQNQAQAELAATTDQLNDTSRELISQVKVSQVKNAEQLQESASLVAQWQKDHEKSRLLVKQLKTALTGTLEKLAGYEKSYAALQESNQQAELVMQQQQEALDKANALLLNAQQQSTSQNLQFTEALSNFSRGYESTQQQLQQSQRCISQLMERNQLLEQENKLLQQRVSMISSEPGPAEPDFDFSELLNTEPQTEFRANSRTASKGRSFFGLALLLPLLLIVGAVINEAGKLDAGNAVTMFEHTDAGTSIEYFESDLSADLPLLSDAQDQDFSLWTS